MVVHLVIGTRPQYVKWAALDAALRKRFTVTVIDTGQHYDDVLTTAFLRDFQLPPPDVNLGVGSKSANAQIASIMMRLESFWRSHHPDFVVVVGDTNSTFAGAFTATKLGFPVGHVEAGIRSFNQSMSEEVNRIVTDHISTLLWCPTKTAVDNLRRERIVRNVMWTGDVTYELFLRERRRLIDTEQQRLKLFPHRYIVMTIHRQSNVNNPAKCSEILSGVTASGFPIIFPVHPRTKLLLTRSNISVPKSVTMIDPLGYLSFLGLVKDAAFVVTDSGGLMRESAWLGVRAIVTREETEWPELVGSGWNVLVGADAARIVHAFRKQKRKKSLGNAFGDCRVSVRIVQSLSRWFRNE